MTDVEGSTTDLEGRPKGQGYGYVPEAACQMVNSGKLMFLLHDRQINSIAYAKNGSDPITVGTAHASLAALDAATVAAGTCDYYLGSSSVGAYARLGTSPDRMVTFTFEGDVDATDGYVQSAAYLMLRIAKRRGGLVDAEIDTAAFTALHTMNTSRCGLFITEEITVGQALDMLANSIGAWWGFTAAGLLTCGRLDLPLAGDTPDITLTQDDLVDPDTPIEELVLDGTNGGIPARNVILNYGPIFGVQQPGELVQGASAGTREYFRQQYRRLDSPDAGVATAHLHSEEIEFTSLIIDRANAVTERARLATIYGAERQRFRAPVTTSRLTADDLGETSIGGKVLLLTDHKGLGHGRLYVILGVIPDWDRGVTVLDLWGGVLATGYTDTFDDSVLIQDGADYLFPSD